jgi:hypothetical protein
MRCVRPTVTTSARVVGLGVEARGEPVQAREGDVGDHSSGGDVQRSREGVVAGLADVHVVVRVDGAPEHALGQRREYFVHVHVGARARACLVDVHRELVDVLAVGHSGRRLLDRVGHVGVDDAQPCVDGGSRPLHQGQGRDDRRVEPLAGDGEVLDRSLRLGPPERLRGHLHLAHRVVLGTHRLVLVHASILVRGSAMCPC